MDSTRGSISADADSAGFYLVEDKPPSLVEAGSRYEIKSELGRGGMGVVYRATDLDLHRDVAIKILRKEFVSVPEAIQQFTNESSIMGRLQHPGIAHVYQCGFASDDRPFHAMKLVNGKTLCHYLRQRSKGHEPKVPLLAVYSAVCQAMAYTHSQQVIHLDLKPANIMVGPFGEVHLMDWGLARSIVPSGQQDTDHYSLDETSDFESDDSNHVHGTLRYMAPEQARAEPVDKRTDVFCLGSILCEILTGHPPYSGKDRVKVLAQAQCAILAPALKRLDKCNADPTLIRLAKNCLHPAREDRPDDARTVASEMASYGESALERVEKDMTRFFELSLDLFCIAGFDGFFRRINSNFSRVLGYSEAELLDRPFLDLVYEKDQSRTVDAMTRLYEGEPLVHFRNRYLAADGKLIEFEWSAKSMVTESLIFAVARQVR